MSIKLANARPVDIEFISHWMRRELIENGNKRYLDHAATLKKNASRPTGIWVYTVNDEAVVFARFAEPNLITHFVTHPHLSSLHQKLAAQTLLDAFAAKGCNIVCSLIPDEEANEILKSVGFTVNSEGDYVEEDLRNIYMEADLRKLIDLSNEPGEVTTFSFRFYAGTDPSNVVGSPYAKIDGIGVLSEVQELHLPITVLAHRHGESVRKYTYPSENFSNDTIVEIEVGGNIIVRDRLNAQVMVWLGAEMGTDRIVHFKKLDLLTYKHLDFKNAPNWV